MKKTSKPIVPTGIYSVARLSSSAIIVPVYVEVIHICDMFMWWWLIGQAGAKKPRIDRPKDMNATMNDDDASASGSEEYCAPTPVKPTKKASAKNDDSDDCFIVD